MLTIYKTKYPQRVRKQLLTEFWVLIKKSKADYLTILKQYSKIKIEPTGYARSPKSRRLGFIKNRDIISKPGQLCFICKNKAQCRHHIIEIRHGGSNAASNIVPLCNKCHALIHPWL